MIDYPMERMGTMLTHFVIIVRNGVALRDNRFALGDEHRFSSLGSISCTVRAESVARTESVVTPWLEHTAEMRIVPREKIIR